MQFHWLNKQNNDKLIVFFAGWSFDYKPFEFLKCDDFDVLLVYDYNNFAGTENIPSKYKHKVLISWSMGVYVAYQLKNLLPVFDEKIAINGTPYPVDDDYGIPLKPFILTLRHAKTGLEGKFYQNIFAKPEEYNEYSNNQVQRTVENRVSELNELYEKIKNTPKSYEKFYDKAFVSLDDKIIPAKNQINFWKSFDTEFKELESGHFPYYNFKSWKDLL